MSDLKVSGRDSGVFPVVRSYWDLMLQQEKEALDDLAMELELADEDQPVLYVRMHLLERLHVV